MNSGQVSHSGAAGAQSLEPLTAACKGLHQQEAEFSNQSWESHQGTLTWGTGISPCSLTNARLQIVL